MSKNQPVDNNTQIGVVNGADEGYCTATALADLLRPLIGTGAASNGFASGAGAPTDAPASGGPLLYIDTDTTPDNLYWWDGDSWELIGDGSGAGAFDLCNLTEATQAQIDAMDQTDFVAICIDNVQLKVPISALAQLLGSTAGSGLYPEWFNTVAGDRSMVVDYNQSDNTFNPLGASFTVGPDGAYIKLYAADWTENDSTGNISSVTARQWFAHVNPGDVVTLGSLATGKVDVNGVEWVGNNFVAQQPLIDALVYTAPTEWNANGRVYGKLLDGAPAAFGFTGAPLSDKFMPRYLDTDLPGTTEGFAETSNGSNIEQVPDDSQPLVKYRGLEKETVVYERQTDVIGGSRTMAPAVSELETYYFGALVGNSNLSGAVNYTKIGAIVYKASGYREPTGYLDNQTSFDRGGNADVPAGGLT